MPHAQASGFPSPCVWLADRLTPVGQDRLILTCSGSGDPELQRWARCLGGRRDIPVPIRKIETGRSLLPGHRSHRDREVSPTGNSPFFTVAWGPVPRDGSITIFHRSAGACPPRSPLASYVFRSFRTYMSIEKRVVPFSRSFRSLIKHARPWQKLLRT